MQANKSLNKKGDGKRDDETYARLTVPEHITESRFLEHQRVEGYYENRDVPEFMGSDRLFRSDTLYGTVQMGYDPKRGQSFLFANIKTSVFDTAASRYQRELKEYQMMRQQKTGNQNLAFSSKRRGGSAVILYKKDSFPWSRRTVLPYLSRANMEAFGKTMPFLDRDREHSDRADMSRQRGELSRRLKEMMNDRKYSEMAAVRSEQTALSARENETNALIYRKDSRQRLFFRRLNSVLDMQKREMFAYYRDRREGGAMAERELSPPQGAEDEND